ncbi:hypothetical protein D3C71_1988310 [compost metagenome]
MVPGLDPFPWHVSQDSFLDIFTSFFVPNAASSKVIVILYLKSAPFVGPFFFCVPPKPPNPPPNTLPKISSKSISMPPPNPEKSNPPNPPAPPNPAFSKLDPN